jgi:signal transduction histidine kinase
MRRLLTSFIRRHGDEVLAAALTAEVLAEILLRPGPAQIRLPAGAVALAVGLAAARRVNAPLPFLALMLAISVVAAALPNLFGAFQPLGLLVFLLLAVYSAAAHTNGRRMVVAAGLTFGLYLNDFIAIDPAGVSPEGLIFYALLLGAPWVAGRAIRQRRLVDIRLEQEKARTAAAVVDERARIARELHDVVAHSISVMILQARGGRRVLESEPGDARDAFAVIEQAGQQALVEMRRLLGMLRRSDEELALAPQPSLKELNRLVEQVETAGLPVEMVLEGEPRELPPGVELSAFRIVQEALTNALRHAGPAHARVTVRFGADDLELEISDDGAGSGGGPVAGYGLVGMRERVAVYGGELHAGQRPEGGFALRVRLPLGSPRP